MTAKLAAEPPGLTLVPVGGQPSLSFVWLLLFRFVEMFGMFLWLVMAEMMGLRAGGSSGSLWGPR